MITRSAVPCQMLAKPYSCERVQPWSMHRLIYHAHKMETIRLSSVGRGGHGSAKMIWIRIDLILIKWIQWSWSGELLNTQHLSQIILNRAQLCYSAMSIENPFWINWCWLWLSTTLWRKYKPASKCHKNLLYSFCYHLPMITIVLVFRCCFLHELRIKWNLVFFYS